MPLLVLLVNPFTDNPGKDTVLATPELAVQFSPFAAPLCGYALNWPRRAVAPPQPNIAYLAPE